MNETIIKQCAVQLYQALRTRQCIRPLTDIYPEMTIDDAYQVSLNLNELRLADGERIIGKKIGVTSKAVMNMLKVGQPDFGFLTDKMVFSEGEEVPISGQLIQPKAEGEIAFILKQDLLGPGVTAADVLAATDFVMPAIEVVDSRIEDWKIKIQDTVADNASCGVFVLGDKGIDPRKVDLATCGMVVEKNGAIVSTGAGAAALDSPVNCVVWLANTLGRYGISLKAGEVIMSGSLVPLEPVKAGDNMRVTVGGIGSVSARFV
jgi:2-oxopent-4-enoate/cis-2-oxohex-4-enoate hydratase